MVCQCDTRWNSIPGISPHSVGAHAAKKTKKEKIKQQTANKRRNGKCWTRPSLHVYRSSAENPAPPPLPTNSRVVFHFVSTTWCRLLPSSLDEKKTMENKNSPIILFPSLKLSLQFEHFFKKRNKEINGRYTAIFIWKSHKIDIFATKKMNNNFKR